MQKVKKQKFLKVKKQASCCRDNPLVNIVNYLAEHGKESLAKRIVKSMLK
jgi:ribosomal protein S7